MSLTELSEPHEYTAMVKDLAGQRRRLTLQIRGADPQGAFDWCCSNRGLERIGELQKLQEEKASGAELPNCKRLGK